MALLFHGISQGTEIRTTPTQSPRHESLRGSTHGKGLEDASPPQQQVNGVEGHDREVSPSDQAEASLAEENNTLRGRTVRFPSITDERRSRRTSPRPPPILKKIQTGAPSGLLKTARIQTPTWGAQPGGTKDDEEDDDNDDDDVKEEEKIPTAVVTGKCVEVIYPKRLPARSASESTADESERADKSQASSTVPVNSKVSRSVAPETSIPLGSSTSKANKKKATFSVPSAANKRRPNLGRRKSSQTSSSGNTSKAASPKLADRPGTQEDTPPQIDNLEGISTAANDLLPLREDLDKVLKLPKDHEILRRSSRHGDSTRTSRSASPHSARPSRRTSPDRPQLDLSGGPPGSASEGAVHHAPLVDNNFRARFAADRSRRVGSSTSLVNPMSTAKSSTATASASFYVGTDNEEETEDEEVTRSERGSGPSTLIAAGAGKRAVVSRDHPSTALPRTKSQLTMLLEKDQQRQKSNR